MSGIPLYVMASPRERSGSRFQGEGFRGQGSGSRSQGLRFMLNPTVLCGYARCGPVLVSVLKMHALGALFPRGGPFQGPVPTCPRETPRVAPAQWPGQSPSLLLYASRAWMRVMKTSTRLKTRRLDTGTFQVQFLQNLWSFARVSCAHCPRPRARRLGRYVASVQSLYWG